MIIPLKSVPSVTLCSSKFSLEQKFEKLEQWWANCGPQASPPGQLPVFVSKQGCTGRQPSSVAHELSAAPLATTAEVSSFDGHRVAPKPKTCAMWSLFTGKLLTSSPEQCHPVEI